MGTSSTIAAVAIHLPSQSLDNETLAKIANWTAAEIFQKTGVRNRRVAAPNESTSDLAVAAVKSLFSEAILSANEAEFLILCTQTPDHILPTTACLVQDRTGLSTTCAAFDVNLGCSGYIYALSIADAFISSGRYRKGIVVTADTYTHYVNPYDRSSRTIFGDAATATVVSACDAPGLGEFTLGTDGRGGKNLIIPAGGSRQKSSAATSVAVEDRSGNRRSADDIFMNGPEIFTFTLQRVPEVIHETLRKAKLSLDEVDWFVFHQANQYMLDHLRKKIGMPRERMLGRLEDVGNTVSSSIPLVLEQSFRENRFKRGERVMLVGFGVGYSWGAAMWYPH